MSGPYDDRSRQPGLAISLRPSPDRTVWRLVLRSAVRFQDGTPFNAGAVLANARRWQSSSPGQRLLPDLFAVDAPRPHEVRFQFSAARRDAPELLASPRLGIVSPQALRPRSGERARFRPVATETGTGPFRLESRTETAIALVRDPGWWGTAYGLGPALDGVGFTAVPDEGRRLELLRSGAVEVAQPIGKQGVEAVSEDPLLRSSGRGAEAIAYEASVRGLDQDSAAPLLSTVWLTTIAD
jgi:ABC-type transport system substrate-binding protein